MWEQGEEDKHIHAFPSSQSLGQDDIGYLLIRGMYVLMPPLPDRGTAASLPRDTSAWKLDAEAWKTNKYKGKRINRQSVRKLITAKKNKWKNALKILPAYNSGPYTAPTTGLNFQPETEERPLSTQEPSTQEPSIQDHWAPESRGGRRGKNVSAATEALDMPTFTFACDQLLFRMPAGGFMKEWWHF